MAKCVRCGTKMTFFETEYDGLCEPCRKSAAAEEKEVKAKARRERTYAELKERCGRPALQRIYDRFIEQYPNALITGIEVTKLDEQLLIHLDGKPAYYVTFNPLTNDVDLEKYSPNPTPSSQKQTSPGQEQKSGCSGCFMTAIGLFLLFIVALGFFSWLFGSIDGGISTSSTPKVTAAPTVTAPADDLKAWVSYYIASSLPKKTRLNVLTCAPCTDELSNVLVIMSMDVLSDGKQYIRTSSEFIVDFCKHISQRDDVNQLTIHCNGPFLDKYGNEIIDVGVRVVYTSDTLKRLNYDYFSSRTYSDPTGIIHAADDYEINPLYLD